jgi:hypothetical protein
VNVLFSRHNQLAAGRVSDLLIVAAPGSGWPDDEWRDHMEQTAELRARLGSQRVVLTYSPDGAPSARQRRIVNDYRERIGVADVRAQAVISQSALVRGAVTAMTWLMRPPYEMRSYPVSQLNAAFAMLRPHGEFDVTRATELLVSMLVELRADKDVERVKQQLRAQSSAGAP